MSAYVSSPFAQRKSLLPDTIGYSWGSFDTHNPGCRMSIQSVAISSNVATLAVTILEGPIPVITAGVSAPLITVTGTQTATSGGAPNFNVTNVALASVSINATTGIGTLTFALTSSNIATTADSGMALVPAPIQFETLPTSATSGLAFAVSRSTLAQDSQRGISWFTLFAGSPATVSIKLQGADVDQDSAYTTVDTSTVATGESRSVGTINYNFYRINAICTGGTSPTFAAGISVR